VRIAVLQANLGSFDTPQDPVEQAIPFTFHRWTDDNFPPITGLSPRLQYRIPKTHGFEMFPGYEYYLWLDGAVTLLRNDCLKWYLDQLDGGDIAFFKHPFRRNVRQEVAHIEEHLEQGKPYITARYKNGLHREFLDRILAEGYPDKTLYASTAFIYRNTEKVQSALRDWWYEGTRYFTCDQVQLPYICYTHDLDVRVLSEPIYKSGYISLVSHHKER